MSCEDDHELREAENLEA